MVDVALADRSVAAVPFRFATDVLRRLGEELVPSPDLGILELVKNAYDANARGCHVELIGTDQAGGSVRISDDGDGMSIQDLTDGFLVIGGSRKSRDTITRVGRIPSGDKGLGRLAALRLGSRVSLVTRPGDEPENEYRLRINWGAYDEAQVIEDVIWNVERHRRAHGAVRGTEIHVEDLGSKVGRMDVKRLARAMILLADPFGDDPGGFQPSLSAPEFEDLEKLVKERYFQDADWFLGAELDSKGDAKAIVRDWRGEELFHADHAELANRRGERPYLCPPARFNFWVFLLTRRDFAVRGTSLTEIRNWLESFGGVHLYYNGLRVAPYGNEGNDWLEMNLRRARSPEERPSTNTSIGRVSIADREGHLLQKTDRSGFVETETFLELRAFAQDAMEWLARRRLELAEQRRARRREEVKKTTSRSRQRLEKRIEQLPVPAPEREALQKALRTHIRAEDKEKDALRREVQLYRTLSTAGITAATFAHESSGNPLKSIELSISAIDRRARGLLEVEVFKRSLEKPIKSIQRATDSLAVLGSATLKLIRHDKRRLGRVDLHPVIRDVLQTFHPFFEGRGVEVEVVLCDGEPYVRGSSAAIESIVTNLLNNSLVAFESSTSASRLVRVETLLGDVWTLRFQDNGPGIDGISLEDIWLPGQTTRPGGTGLGLTIVRDAVRDLGGSVEAREHGELGGAEFLIHLPILGA